jgi:hypothetical protein
MIRRALISGLMLVLASAPSLARAQDDDRPKRPPPPRPPVQTPVVPAAKAAPRPDAPSPLLAAPLTNGTAFAGRGFQSGGLADGGLRSNLPVISDGAGVCRASCAKTRYTCLATDDPVLCDPQWTQCLTTCR